MKQITLMGLFLCATLVSAYPYSPYSDNKDNSKNAELSHDVVAEFIRNKIEKELIQPAYLSDYILALMQGKKPTQPTETDSNTTTDKSKFSAVYFDIFR